MKSPDEMCKLFNDLPDATERTQEIAEKCDVELEFGTMHMPEFPIPGDMITAKVIWSTWPKRGWKSAIKL